MTGVAKEEEYILKVATCEEMGVTYFKSASLGMGFGDSEGIWHGKGD
jgi:hypothetical protein